MKFRNEYAEQVWKDEHEDFYRGIYPILTRSDEWYFTGATSYGCVWFRLPYITFRHKHYSVRIELGITKHVGAASLFVESRAFYDEYGSTHMSTQSFKGDIFEKDIDIFSQEIQDIVFECAKDTMNQIDEYELKISAQILEQEARMKAESMG